MANFSFLLKCMILLVVCIIQSEQWRKCQEWELVFRAVSGNGQSVIDSWKKRQSCYHCYLKKGCLQRGVKLEGLRNLPSVHLKSPLVNEWSVLKIQEVKVVLYDNGGRVANYLVFDGRNSNYMNWFHRSRLRRSGWRDLSKRGSFNYFSIPGHGRHGRHFYINRSYGGCHKDNGWFVINDTKGSRACRWEKHKRYPQFLYGRHGKRVRYQSFGYGKADVMAIYIRRR